MIYNKRPLIYMPRKKTVKKAQTQSLNSFFVTSQWMYSPTIGSQPGYPTMPQYIIYNPETMDSHVGPDNKLVLKGNHGPFYRIYPIVADDSYNFKQAGDLMRWTSIYPGNLSSAQSNVLFTQAFILLPGTINILRLYDSSRSQPYIPYNIKIVDDGAITVDSTLTIHKNKFNDTGYLTKVVTALSNAGYDTDEGLLVLVDTGRVLPTIQSGLPELSYDQLLEYSSGIQNSMFGRHTDVIDFDIA